MIIVRLLGFCIILTHLQMYPRSLPAHLLTW